MKLKISGIEGYDGEYDVDFDDLTQGEIAEMESIAKVPFAKFEDGYLSVVVALAAAMLKRAGKPVVLDMLWHAKAGAITMVQNGDAGPPAVSPARFSVGETSNSALSATENGSANQDAGPNATGDRGLETSVGSSQETSAL